MVAELASPLLGAKPLELGVRGGFSDTVEEGVTGVFFDPPTPSSIGHTLEELLGASWDDDSIRAHPDSYSEDEFIERLRAILGESSRTEDPVLV